MTKKISKDDGEGEILLGQKFVQFGNELFERTINRTKDSSESYQ